MYLDYTGIRVRDLAKSLQFYGHGLGLLEIRRGTNDLGGSWVLLEDPVSRQRLELHYYRPDSPHATHWKTGEELDHIGVRSEDAETLTRRLVSAGAQEVARIPRPGLGDVIHVEDPNGIVIEIHPMPEALSPPPMA